MVRPQSRCVLFVVSFACACAPDLATAQFANPARVSINDNRAPAGTLNDGVQTIHLEARTGEWHPDSDEDPGTIVRAFAVEDAPLQVPAPLIRVVEGTTIDVHIRNRLDVPLVVHGLYTRPGGPTAADAVTVPPGDVREVRFDAGTPGTYFYWASSTADPQLGRRAGIDAPLSGAFVIDPKGSSAPDRVLVATSWGNGRPVNDSAFIGRLVINGKSWPHTERLTYDVGDSVRLRVLNVGLAVHTMHLHGFYFTVDSRGDETVDDMRPTGPRQVNTERLASGRTFTLTWHPTRAGNWLFHCHDSVHLRLQPKLDGHPATPAAHDHTGNHALEGMAGPVVGITVRAKGTATTAEPRTRRRLRLVARVDQGGTEAEPAYGYTFEDGNVSMPAAPPYLPGPTIVLKRGEPVAITVENRLPEPTSVHWHGIELESYYDGVPGFAGTDGRIAPAIEPGKTFEARFTPPRSGTFIYHSHVDEVRQQQAGLSGALIVVDDPRTYDPAHNLVVLVTAPRRLADDNVVLIDGSATPATREMRLGERYRLRLINVHVSRPNIRIRLLRDGAPVMWRALAKDGMDLSPGLATTTAAEQQIGNGETYDFEFTPTMRGEHTIQVTTGAGMFLASMPVRVN